MSSSFAIDQSAVRYKKNQYRSRWQYVLCALLVTATSGLLFFPETHDLTMNSRSFCPDEPGWVASSYYYTELLRTGQLDWEKWDCETCGSGASYGSLNMHLGEWLMAIPLTLHSPNKGQPFSGYYDVDRTLEQNIREGNVPPADVLVDARSAAAFFGVLCCLMVFTIGFWVYNASIGVIASGLVMLNPVVIRLSAQAMTDTFYNFFLLACCLVFVALYKTTDKRRALLLVALAGMMTGLACSVKVTGFVVGSSLFAVICGWLFYSRKSGVKAIATAFLVFWLVSLGTVYLLNPLFWVSLREFNASATMQEISSVSTQVAKTKKLPWHQREAFLADTRYPQLKNLSHPLEFPLLFLRWKNTMERQATRGWDGWTGPRLLALNRSLLDFALPLGPHPPENPTSLLFIAAAIFTFFWAGAFFLVRSKSSRSFFMQDGSYLVPPLCFLINYIFIAASMKLNWDRYYLPTLINAEFIVAVGIYLSTKSILGYLRLWTSRA